MNISFDYIERRRKRCNRAEVCLMTCSSTLISFFICCLLFPSRSILNQAESIEIDVHVKQENSVTTDVTNEFQVSI